MSSLDQFVMDSPRPLPVIVLADISGSMQGSKIAALNAALKELVQDLADTKQPQGEIHLGLITFATHVDVGEVVPASQAHAQEYSAGGRTAMGAAIDAARSLLEDAERLPQRAYTPTLVLVSDGAPTDHFERAVQNLLDSERGKRATRMALAIGDDADTDVLKRFIADPETPLMHANEVAKIRDFFRWVTYSVQARSRSRNPDAALVAPPAVADISDDDLVF